MSKIDNKIFPAIVLAMVFVTTMMFVGSMGMSIPFQSTFALTEEQDELGRDDDGKKKSYTDCEGYEEFTEMFGITKEDADYNTDEVDVRIRVLLDHISTTSDEEKKEKLQEELECLQAIRAIEEDALKEFSDTANDFTTVLELRLQQMETNSKIQSLYDKYD